MLSLIAALLATVGIALASLVHTGTTVELCGIHYYIPRQSVAKIGKPSHDLFHGSLFRPITVIETAAAILGKGQIEDFEAEFSHKDDVFQRDFMEGKLNISGYINSSFCLILRSAVYPVLKCEFHTRELRKTHSHSRGDGKERYDHSKWSLFLIHSWNSTPGLSTIRGYTGRFHRGQYHAI